MLVAENADLGHYVATTTSTAAGARNPDHFGAIDGQVDPLHDGKQPGYVGLDVPKNLATASTELREQ